MTGQNAATASGDGSRGTPALRKVAWQAPRLTRVGRLGDVMQGGNSTRPDTGNNRAQA